MDISETFLKASTHDRLTMARDDGNKPELSRLLGMPAYLELRELAKASFDGFHLAPEDPKNVVFVPGVMGSLLMNSSKAGIWWIDVRTRNFIDSLGLSPDGVRDSDPENKIVPVTADPSYTPFLSVALKQQGLKSFHTIGASRCSRAPHLCAISYSSCIGKMGAKRFILSLTAWAG